MTGKRPAHDMVSRLFICKNISRKRRRYKAMWIQCNPNPLGKTTGDCVVRAISIATNQSWRRTYEDLCDLGRIECEMPNTNTVWGLYLERLGFKQFLLPDSCPRCITIQAFCERYPEGTYVIGTGYHAACVIDGDLYDSWPSMMETPTFFWRMK